MDTIPASYEALDATFSLELHSDEKDLSESIFVNTDFPHGANQFDESSSSPSTVSSPDADLLPQVGSQFGDTGKGHNVSSTTEERIHEFITHVEAILGPRETPPETALPSRPTSRTDPKDTQTTQSSISSSFGNVPPEQCHSQARLDFYEKVQEHLGNLKEAIRPISLTVTQLQEELLVQHKRSGNEFPKTEETDEEDEFLLPIRSRNSGFPTLTSGIHAPDNDRGFSYHASGTTSSADQQVPSGNQLASAFFSSISTPSQRPKNDSDDSGDGEEAPSTGSSTTSIPKPGPDNGRFLCVDHPDVAEHEHVYCNDERRDPSVSPLERRMMTHSFFAHARCRTTFASRSEYDGHTCHKACQNTSCWQHLPHGIELRVRPWSCANGCITTQEQLYVILIRLRHGHRARLRMFENTPVPDPPDIPQHIIHLARLQNTPQLAHVPSTGPIPQGFPTVSPFNPGPMNHQLSNDPHIQQVLRLVQTLEADLRTLQADVIHLRQQAHIYQQQTANLEELRRDTLNRQQVVAAFQVMFHDRQNPGRYTDIELRNMVREVIGDSEFEFGWL